MNQDGQRIYGQLGTLYQQCGGVFGVSGFVDKCMDKWMADPQLNANAAVATWHETAQRPGFKFLVVQIMCNLSGGPQIYTGRPMDTSHKHLNISEDEWEKFMEIFNGVCDELALSSDVIGNLNALMISMEEDCVVHPGEAVPRNPGPQVPQGTSLYARLGGVYPIALFVDRLVDGLLADDRVTIPQDEKRNEASLKYLFTELCCSIAGGPEVRTAPSNAETKLLLPKSQWQILINTIPTAADHLPRNAIPELTQTVQRNRDGIVDPASPNDATVADTSAARVKGTREAAAGEHLATIANARRAAGGAASVAARRRVHGDPRTLYGRGGGLFGLAKLSDRLMDVWMENHLLNQNLSVAKWHDSQQKFGFKFLVTQLLGYLTGGPQRYTGQSMAAAHKHLAITANEWNVFAADAERVFREFNLENSVHQELLHIIQGFQQQCVLGAGEPVPADPGLCRKRPDGSTSYANLGGIYPIALFVDRLVEAVVASQIRVRWTDANKACIKYIVTEVLANATGGPELVTATDFAELELGILENEWEQFVEVATTNANIWPTPHHRQLIINAINKKKATFCIGVVEESDVNDARRALLESGFGVIDQAAALDTCNGDAAKALDLLKSGWSPGSQMRRQNSGSTIASLDTDYSAGTTPSVSGAGTGGIGRGGATSTADQALQTTIQVLAECGKDKAGIMELLAIGEPEVDAALAQDRYAIAAKFLSKKKVPLQGIAQHLKMTDARVHGAVYGDGSAQTVLGGRSLENNLQVRLDELLDEDSEMCCPVTLMLFRDPVIASDGFMYEADSVKQLIRAHQASPITREPLKKEYFQAKQKKSEVNTFREQRAGDLLNFADEAVASEPRMASMALDRVMEYLEVLKAAQHPAIARKAAGIWEKTGKPLPAELRPHLGMS